MSRQIMVVLPMVGALLFGGGVLNTGGAGAAKGAEVAAETKGAEGAGAVKVSVAPVIDGVLDEPCWQQTQPLEITPLRDSDTPLPTTLIYVTYTDKALYLGFDCLEPQIEKLRGLDKPATGYPFCTDSVESFLDTNADRSSYLRLGVGPHGVYATQFAPRPGQCHWYEADWHYACKVFQDRYVVEIEMPFEYFPIAQQPLTSQWLVNFVRNRRVVVNWFQIGVYKDADHAGLLHRPDTWMTMGPFDVEVLTAPSAPTVTSAPSEQTVPSAPAAMTLPAGSVGGDGWEFPVGVPENYLPNLPEEMDPSLAWVRTEKVRIFYAWLTSTMRRPTNPMYHHTFQEVVDVVAGAGFNVMAPCSFARTKEQTPYRMWECLDGMIRVRLAGMRTMFSPGWIWRGTAADILEDRLFVTPDGKEDKINICPLETYSWREGLVEPVLDAWAEAERLGVSDLFFGVLFDMESVANGSDRQHCYCDRCWDNYCAVKDLQVSGLAAAERMPWLRQQDRVGDYHQWQEEAMAVMIRRELQAVREVAPHLVFCFYPYYYDDIWTTRAALRGVSTRRAPAIPWDDHTYWTGYSGRPQYGERIRRGTTEMMGYEPLLALSIDYASTSAHYPNWTPDHAGREVYLLTRAGAAHVTYADGKDSYKDLLEDQRPFLEEGFAKAHRQLAADGGIDQAEPKLPVGEVRDKLRAAQTMLQNDIKQMWGKVYGLSRDYSDEPVTGTYDGSAALVLTKALKDHRLLSGSGAAYRFDLTLKAEPRQGRLTIKGTTQAGGLSNLVVKVGGRQLAYVQQVLAGEDHIIQVPVPKELIETTIRIELAHFIGETYWDSNDEQQLSISEVTLEVE